MDHGGLVLVQKSAVRVRERKTRPTRTIGIEIKPPSTPSSEKRDRAGPIAHGSVRQMVGRADDQQGVRGVPLGISRIRPDCLDSETVDRAAAADVLVREEPDDEEEDEENDREEGDDDGREDDDGYSE